MDGNAFEVFIEKCLLPQLWLGAVVVMDNVPSHKVTKIEPLIQSKGASVLYMSPHSPDFNPIERKVVTTIALFYVNSLKPQHSLVDTLIATALDLINAYYV